jgi:hypothetical protein
MVQGLLDSNCSFRLKIRKLDQCSRPSVRCIFTPESFFLSPRLNNCEKYQLFTTNNNSSVPLPNCIFPFADWPKHFSLIAGYRSLAAAVTYEKYQKKKSIKSVHG